VANWFLRDGIYQSGANISDAPLASEWTIVGEEFVPQAFLAPARTGSEVNVAVGCNVTASSIYGGDAKRWGPKFAVDSATSGNVNDGGMYHSNNDSPSDWFRVDLGAYYPISSIILFNRTGSAAITSRLDGCKIMVGKTSNLSEATLFASWNAYGTASERKFTNAAVTERMRYVWVQRNGTSNYLHFAEIHVNVATTANARAKSLQGATIPPLMAYEENNKGFYAEAFASHKSILSPSEALANDGFLLGDLNYGKVFQSGLATRPDLKLVFNEHLYLKAVQIYNSESTSLLDNASILVQRREDPPGTLTHLATWSDNIRSRILRIDNRDPELMEVEEVILRLHGKNRFLNISEMQAMCYYGENPDNANFTEADLILKRNAAKAALGLLYTDEKWNTDFGQWLAFQHMEPVEKAMILDDMADNPEYYLSFVAVGHSRIAVYPEVLINGTRNDGGVEAGYLPPIVPYNSAMQSMFNHVLTGKHHRWAAATAVIESDPLPDSASFLISRDGLSASEFASKLENLLAAPGGHRALVPQSSRPPRSITIDGVSFPPPLIANDGRNYGYIELSNAAAHEQLEYFVYSLSDLASSLATFGLQGLSNYVAGEVEIYRTTLFPNHNAENVPQPGLGNVEPTIVEVNDLGAVDTDVWHNHLVRIHDRVFRHLASSQASHRITPQQFSALLSQMHNANNFLLSATALDATPPPVASAPPSTTGPSIEDLDDNRRSGFDYFFGDDSGL
jgi:hypothetical protein